ncbi:MAG: hypothetical protein KJ574_01740, partial [Nanoarchaeota archaeon]|nr:hypothetical protein [Nanoarchaeota archaeon]
MNRKILSIILALFVILATGCAQNKADISIGEQMTQQSGGDTRSFYMGVVPTPKSIPATTFDDLTEAYKEAGDLGEVTPVWTDPAGIGQYAKLRQNRVITALRVYGLKPVITLNFATIKEVPGKGLQYVIDAPEGIAADLSDSSFRAAWVDEAKNIAQE